MLNSHFWFDKRNNAGNAGNFNRIKGHVISGNGDRLNENKKNYNNKNDHLNMNVKEIRIEGSNY